MQNAKQNKKKTHHDLFGGLFDLLDFDLAQTFNLDHVSSSGRENRLSISFFAFEKEPNPFFFMALGLFYHIQRLNGFQHS